MLYLHKFLDTIVLLGAIQGFIVGTLLFFSGRLKQANRLLAVLIILIALASLNLYLNNEHFLDNSKVFIFISDFIPLTIIMPFGPLIFFYVKSFLDPEFVFTKRSRAHFYPVLIDIVPQVTAIIYVLSVVSGIGKKNGHDWGIFVDTYNIYADIPRWLSITGYLWFSARYISLERNKIKIAGIPDIRNIKWLNQFINVFLAFQAIWLVYLIPYVLPRYTQSLLNWVDWYPIYIPLAIIIYWLGIKGLLMDRPHPAPSKKLPIKGSRLSEAAISQAAFLLAKSMGEDKLFLKPGLNLNVLAHHTGISPKVISMVLNQHLHKSFNEFINEYRIEAFKEKIQSPDIDHLTIAGIAMECGFNSQATFQRTFKQVTGFSPSEYRKDTLEIL